MPRPQHPCGEDTVEEGSVPASNARPPMTARRRKDGGGWVMPRGQWIRRARLAPAGGYVPLPLYTFTAGTGGTRFVSYSRCPNHAAGFRPAPERRCGGWRRGTQREEGAFQRNRHNRALRSDPRIRAFTQTPGFLRAGRTAYPAFEGPFPIRGSLILRQRFVVLYLFPAFEDLGCAFGLRFEGHQPHRSR